MTVAHIRPAEVETFSLDWGTPGTCTSRPTS